jgi:hypothetical protein
MVIKYTKLQLQDPPKFTKFTNLQKLGLLVWKYAIWQPCSRWFFGTQLHKEVFELKFWAFR